MPAQVWLVVIPIGEVEHEAAVVLDEVADGSLNLVLDQVGVALILMVQNAAAEQPQLRNESSIPEAGGDIVVECDTGHERPVPVIVGCGSAGQETLHIADSGTEDRMSRSDSGVEDDDPGCLGRRVGDLIQLLHVGPDEDRLQANARREIDGANVPIAEQVVRHGRRAAHPIDRQIRLPDRVENLTASFVYPCLECATHSGHVVASCERPQFHVDQEEFCIRKPVAPQRPASTVFG